MEKIHAADDRIIIALDVDHFHKMKAVFIT